MACKGCQQRREAMKRKARQLREQLQRARERRQAKP